MELKLLIEKASVIAGDQKTLAGVMGISPDYLAHAKAGRRGLPLKACLTMAELLEIDPILVIYASALRASKTRKEPASLPPAFKNSSRDNLATPSMRLLMSRANVHAAESPTPTQRAEKLRKAFETLDMTNDRANFYKLAFDLPIV